MWTKVIFEMHLIYKKDGCPDLCVQMSKIEAPGHRLHMIFLAHRLDVITVAGSISLDSHTTGVVELCLL